MLPLDWITANTAGTQSMTFISETGTGTLNATSYLSLTDADAHFTALDRSDWLLASIGKRQLALEQASFYVDSYNYPGIVAYFEQGLKWPRSGARDKEGRLLSGLPHALRTAVLELAADYITAPPSASDRRELIKEKIGPMELVYSKTRRQPSFVFRLLMQIGARPEAREIRRS